MRGCLLLGIVMIVAAVTACAPPEPWHFVVLYDMTGSEVGRLSALRGFLIRSAGPHGQGLFYEGDTLAVIPVRAPGKLDKVFPFLAEGSFEEGNASLQRRLETSLPVAVDQEWGTCLSCAIRAAARKVARLSGPRVLLLSGPGEDHAQVKVTASEVRQAFNGVVVVLINAGDPFAQPWTAFFKDAGASAVLIYDAAATQDVYANPDRLRAQISEAAASGRK